jgi:hypothetical protein
VVKGCQIDQVQFTCQKAQAVGIGSKNFIEITYQKDIEAGTLVCPQSREKISSKG